MMFLTALPMLALLLLAAMRIVRRDLARVSLIGPALARCGLPARDLGPLPALAWWRARRPHGLHLPHAP